LSEEEKREPVVEEQKIGSALKQRLDRIQREFYATSYSAKKAQKEANKLAIETSS